MWKPVELHRQRLRLQAEAVAGLAGLRRMVALDLLAHPRRVGLLPAPLEVGDDALEGFGRAVGAEAVVVVEGDVVIAGAVEDDVPRLLRQLAPRRVGRRICRRGPAPPASAGSRATTSCPTAATAFSRSVSVSSGTTSAGSMVLLGAEAVAGRAGAVGIVEREQPRLDLGDGEAGDRAGEFLGEDDAVLALLVALLQLALLRRGLVGLAVGDLGDGQTVGQFQRGLERVRQARGDVAAHHDAVDHHLDVVLELLVEGRGLGDLVEGAVDLDALEALLQQLGQLLAVLALAAAHDRRQQIEARALGQRQHPVDHLADRLAGDRQAGRRRIGDADAGEEQPHVVVDLGDRADGRARVPRRGLLLDRDGRRQAVDLVDVRLLHHLEELAGIGRQRLDVAALALGVDRVEGERRLARARQAGQHDQLVARQVEVDVLEVVLARPADRDELARGELFWGRPWGHRLFRVGGAAAAAPQTYALGGLKQGGAPACNSLRQTCLSQTSGEHLHPRRAPIVRPAQNCLSRSPEQTWVAAVRLHALPRDGRD